MSVLATLASLNPVRAIRRWRRVLASLERLSELETKVDQCIVAYQKDARFADRLAAFPAKTDAAAAAAHVRCAVASAPLDMDPCPHLVIERLVPEDLYDEMLSALPPQVFFKQETGREEMQVPFPFAPAYSRMVWDFFFREVIERTLLPEVTQRLQPALDAFLARCAPSFGPWAESGGALRVSNSRLLLRRPGYEIKPHRDPRWAFVTCLIYLQRRKAAHVYGTQLFRLKHERDPAHHSPFWVGYEDCELAKEVPGTRNTALVFLNSTGVHAASIPPDAPPDLERYVYQVQFGPDEATRERLLASMTDAARATWTRKGSGY